MIRRAILTVVMIVTLGLAGVTWFILSPSEDDDDDEDPLAIGLRGTSKITQTLSDNQQKILEQHLLTTPPPLSSNGASGLSSPQAVIQDIQRINQLNQSNEKN